MSIFKETFRSFIYNQLKVRSVVLGSAEDNSMSRFGSPKVSYMGSIGTGINSSPKEYSITLDPGAFYVNSIERQCVIKMQSGVDLREGHDLEYDSTYEYHVFGGEFEAANLAKQYILEGGTQFYDEAGNFLGNREGFNTAAAKEDKSRGFSYGDRSIRSQDKDGYGVVPMPGITSMDIRTTSAYGSLRVAKVQFECHNRRQLEVLELLYMRPGYPILIEWGWTPYVDNDGKIQHMPVFMDRDMFYRENGYEEVTYDKIHREIDKKKKKAHGNYDGFLGFCKNFEFKQRDDGGFSCFTEVIAMGEILESLKGRSEDLDGNERFAITFEEYLTATTGIDRNTTSLRDSQIDAFSQSFDIARRWSAAPPVISATNDEIFIDENGVTSADVVSFDKGIYDNTIQISRTYDGWLKSKVSEYMEYEGDLSKHLYPVDILELFMIALNDTPRREGVLGMFREKATNNDFQGRSSHYWKHDLEEEMYKDNPRSVGIKTSDYVRLVELVQDILGFQSGIDMQNVSNRLHFLKAVDVVDFIQNGLLYDMNYLQEDTWDYNGFDDKSHTNPLGFSTEGGKIKLGTLNPWKRDKYYEDDNPVYDVKYVDGQPQLNIFNDAPLKLKGTDFPVERVPATFIRWDFLAEIINQFAIPSYNKVKSAEGDSPLNREGIIKITYQRDDIDNPGKGEYLKYSKFFIPDPEAIANNPKYVKLGKLVDRSIDPTVCLLPHQSFIKKRNLANSEPRGLFENAGDGVFLQGVPEFAGTGDDQTPRTNRHGEIWNYDDFEKKYEGHQDILEGMYPLRGTNKANTENSIGYIYLNLTHLIKTYKELRYSDENDGTKSFRKDFSLFKFLEKIWDDVNKATSDIHDFRIQTVHDDPNTIRVIDLQFDSENMTEREAFFELDVEGKNSIVRSFNYSSTIPSSLSSTIAIAAQANQDIDDLEAVTFAAFNHNIESRFADPDALSDPVEEYLKKRQSLMDNVSQLGSYFGNVEGGLGWYDNNLATAIPIIKKDTAYRLVQNIIKDVVVLNSRYPVSYPDQGKRGRMKPAKELKMGKSAIIPLNFNARLDGIGGVVIGNIFKINKQHLPTAYQDDNINFVVLKESQKVTEGQDWYTDISGQLILQDRKQDPTVTTTQSDHNDLRKEALDRAMKKGEKSDTPNADIIRDYYRGWKHPDSPSNVSHAGTVYEANNGDMATTHEDGSPINLVDQTGRITISNSYSDGDITLEMAKMMIRIWDDILDMDPTIHIRITSGRRGNHTGSSHAVGNAIDFRGPFDMTADQWHAIINIISFYVATEPTFDFINEYQQHPKDIGVVTGKWSKNAYADHFHCMIAVPSSNNPWNSPYVVHGKAPGNFKWLVDEAVGEEEVDSANKGGGARRNGDTTKDPSKKSFECPNGGGSGAEQLGCPDNCRDNPYYNPCYNNDHGELCPGEGKVVQKRRLQNGEITPPVGRSIITIRSDEEATYDNLTDPDNYYNDDQGWGLDLIDDIVDWFEDVF